MPKKIEGKEVVIFYQVKVHLDNKLGAIVLNEEYATDKLAKAKANGIMQELGIWHEKQFIPVVKIDYLEIISGEKEKKSVTV